MHRTKRAFVPTIALLATLCCLPAGAVVLQPDVITVGTVITLTLDSTLTQLANENGTLKETTTLNTLSLVPGSITVPVGFVYDVPALSTWALILLAASLALIAIRSRM